MENICTSLKNAINSDSVEQGKKAIEDFVSENEKNFVFSHLLPKDLAVFTECLESVFLKFPDWIECQVACLCCLRILSRDPSACNLLCKKDTIFPAVANFADLTVPAIKSPKVPEPDADVMARAVLESTKCFCNFCFNSAQWRALLVSNPELIRRLIDFSCSTSDDYPHDDLKQFRLKLLFILTAMNKDLRSSAISNYDAMAKLHKQFKVIIENAADGSPIPDLTVSCISEALKVRFNLGLATIISSEELAGSLPIFLSLMDLSTRNDEQYWLIVNDVVNCMTTFSADECSVVAPEFVEGEAIETMSLYKDRDMKYVDKLLEFLTRRLDVPTSEQRDSLAPILNVLANVAASHPDIRRYIRAIVLPPLKDASTRPEEGTTLRNRLVRLMQSVTDIASMAAGFLYEVCGRSVSRLVKYTGFGNAAGLIVERGLLGPKGAEDEAECSDDDSETEEYSQIKHKVNPVTGCVQLPGPDPFEGMTEEQKEYEAMKLVNELDKMTRGDSAVRPARIGPDGTLQAVEHVLELQEQNGAGDNGTLAPDDSD